MNRIYFLLFFIKRDTNGFSDWFRMAQMVQKQISKELGMTLIRLD